MIAVIEVLKKQINENEKELKSLPPHPLHDLPHRKRAELEIFNTELEIAIEILEDVIKKEEDAIRLFRHGARDIDKPDLNVKAPPNIIEKSYSYWDAFKEWFI